MARGAMALGVSRLLVVGTVRAVGWAPSSLVSGSRGEDRCVHVPVPLFLTPKARPGLGESLAPWCLLRCSSGGLWWMCSSVKSSGERLPKFTLSVFFSLSLYFHTGSQQSSWAGDTGLEQAVGSDCCWPAPALASWRSQCSSAAWLLLPTCFLTDHILNAEIVISVVTVQTFP